MLFSYDITISANTLEVSPKKETLALSAGVITKIGIRYPLGCNNMVKVKLLHEDSQLIPVNRGSWIIGNDEEVKSDEYYELTKKFKEIIFIGCSPDTLYDHTITVRVTVLPREVATWLPFMEILSRFLKRLGLGI